MAYIGKSPSGTGVRQRYYFTATGGETTLGASVDDNGLTLSYSDGAYVDVLLNGIELVAGTDYNTNTANRISGLAALAASDVVTVTVYDIFTVADTVSAKDGGTFSSNVVMNADLTVDTNTLYVDSTNNRLGVGTTSPSWNIHAFQSGALNSVFESDTGNSNVRITSGDGDNAQMFFGDQTNDTISIIRHDNSDNSLQFHTAATQRMNINSSGNFLLGANYISTGTRLNVESDGSSRASDIYRPTSTSTSHISNFYSDVGGTKTLQSVMEASGDVESRTNNFTGTSDRTLKENIVDANSQWDDIKALEVKNFNFIIEPERTLIGVIAQDVEAAGMTGLVKTSAETGKMSVKYSVLYMKAVKALQEAMTKIETLETEMTSLKARVQALEDA